MAHADEEGTSYGYIKKSELEGPGDIPTLEEAPLGPRGYPYNTTEESVRVPRAEVEHTAR